MGAAGGDSFPAQVAKEHLQGPQERRSTRKSRVCKAGAGEGDAGRSLGSGLAPLVGAPPGCGARVPAWSSLSPCGLEQHAQRGPANQQVVAKLL